MLARNPQPPATAQTRTLDYYLFFYSIMPVVTVPVPNDADILAWTRESLEGSPVAARLRPLFDILRLQHLDKNDPARGARQGRGYAKPDLIDALLAHQAAVRATSGAAASPAFAVNDIVQFRL